MSSPSIPVSRGKDNGPKTPATKVVKETKLPVEEKLVDEKPLAENETRLPSGRILRKM